MGGGGYYLSRGDGSGRMKVNKGEVSRLCEHFNIKADNPCAVLTQEHAKKFLHGNNNEAAARPPASTPAPLARASGPAAIPAAPAAPAALAAAATAAASTAPRARLR